MESKQINNEYSIKIVKSIEEVEEIRNIWEGMQWHPNADIDFYITIFNSRNEMICPYIIIVYQYDTPIVMIIGRLEKIKFECRIGYQVIFKPFVRCLTVIYGGVLGNVTLSNSEMVIAELMKTLTRNEADLIYFDHLESGSCIDRTVRTLPGILQRDLFQIPNVHWKMNLPETMEEFYQKFSSNTRHQLRRYIKKIEKAHPGNLSFKKFQNMDEVDKLYHDVEKIAQLTYHRGMGAGFIYNTENYHRLELSASHGWLRAYILYIEDKPCSFYIGTLYSNTIYLSFTGYNPDYKKFEPGTVAFMKMIEDLINKEVKEVDFGFGDAFYKQRFGDQNWRETSLYIYSRTLDGIKLNIMRTSTTIINECAKKILNSLNILRVIKKRWRAQLAHRSQ
jgi:hypothetical protein